MNLIQQIEAEEIAKATSGAGKDIPEFRPGDTLRVGEFHRRTIGRAIPEAPMGAGKFERIVAADG